MSLALVVLAAGLGTRMKSALPKVLHTAGGYSLLSHVLNAGLALNPKHIEVVIGPDMELVAQEARLIAPNCGITLQKQRDGTAGAIRCVQPALRAFKGTVLILYGDVPLIRSESLSALLNLISPRQPMAVLGFEARVPFGYGRLIVGQDGGLQAIREESDSSVEEKSIRLCNSGIIAIHSDVLWPNLSLVKNDNSKNEYYLTDLVALLVERGMLVGLAHCEEEEVSGVNDRQQLAQAEAYLQKKYRERALLNGATLIAPETVFFASDTKLGCDVVIEPYVVFGPKTLIGDRVRILAFSHIEGAYIASGARIGPYARLRAGTDIGQDAHIGNFVEIKNSQIGKATKANHLSYLGDAKIGERSNIGAGTITGNYDGFNKHKTIIGDEVFVGSNSVFVAPACVGDAATIAAGSIITKTVAPGDLAISRPKLEMRPGWSLRFREKKRSQEPYS